MNTTALTLNLYPQGTSLSDPSTWPPALIAVILISANLLIYIISKRAGSSKTSIPSLSGFPWQNAWLFFTKRHDFLKSGFTKTGNLFQFRVNQHRIVAMRGEAARKYFYSDRNLSFTEGYKILMGGGPRLKDIQIESNQVDDISWFQKKITHLLRPERLRELIPQLLADLDRSIAMWPDSGKLNPFENVYDLVFQLTARAATAREIADDPAQVARLGKLYWTIEHGSNPRAMIFPWLPNAAVKAKDAATRELYGMIVRVVEGRKNRPDGEKDQDPIQVLVDSGDSVQDIVGFVLATLFAGVVNTGINASWSLLFLAGKPEWKARATTEVNEFIAKHASPPSASVSLATRLGQVDPNAWESDLPTLDLVIRETIRIMSRGAALRRNVHADAIIEGRRVEKGAFLAHPASSIHFDETVYPNPTEYDPGRYEAGREEDRKVPFGFVGWGAGRHPCLGMRFAKLEIKAILALFLAGTEYEHVNVKGQPTRVLASDIDRNNIFQARPKGDPPFINYKKVAL